MTSRERVEKTVHFQTPDRVPIDLGAMKASGIAVEAYARLKRVLGLPGKPRVMDTRLMIAHVEEDVLRRFHVDVVPLDLSCVVQQLQPESAWTSRTLFSGTETLFPPGTRIHEAADGGWVLCHADGTPTSFHMPKNGYYFDDIAFDRAEGDFDPALFQPRDSIPEETLRQMERMARRLHESTEYALLGWGGGVCFLGLSVITDRTANVTQGRPSDWMMMLLTEKDTCHELMNRSVEASIRCLTQLHQAVGPYCFAWGIAADDSGTQRGEFLHPDLWAEMILPHYRKLCDWIHAHTRWKTFFHSCGSVYRLIPHFIEAGIDILNPVQVSAAEMDPARLKREFGRRIVFWGGGCDTQRVLNQAAPDAVRRHVREQMAVFKSGGGYVFNQVHNIQANVPPENIVAMLDAAYACGGYES